MVITARRQLPIFRWQSRYPVVADLQELCSKLKEKYDGDATKLRVEGEDSIEKVKARLMQFKGIGTLFSQ